MRPLAALLAIALALAGCGVYGPPERLESASAANTAAGPAAADPNGEKTP